MTDDRLDALLSAPLPAIEDRGFSARVLSAAFARREWQAGLELFGLLAAGGVIGGFFPFNALDNTIYTVTRDLGNSLPVAMAALAIVLSLSLARMVAD